MRVNRRLEGVAVVTKQGSTVWLARLVGSAFAKKGALAEHAREFRREFGSE